MLILPNSNLVLRAWAALVDAAPGTVDYAEHMQFIKDNGRDGYIAALNDYLSAYSDEQVAAALLKNTGLDKIDLEGDGKEADGSYDNMGVAKAFLAGNANNRAGAILDLTFELLKHRAGVGEVATVAKAFSAKIEGGYAYATNQNNTTAQVYGAARELDLSTGKDVLKGSALSDFFKAYEFDGKNTLQSGDVLDGGAGDDTLFADIGNSQKFAITPETKGIENVLIRVQANGNDPKDNHLAPKESKVDAQRMKDVLNWENNNSRSDLVIEDVRINDNQVTKDITITMRETDSGHVDYGVYFDQNSLRNYTDAISQINLRVLDTHNTNLSGKPSLKDSPYGSFTFYAKETGSTGEFIKFTFANKEMQNAQTLEEMVAALQKAADSTLGAGAVTVSLGVAYTVPDPVSKKTVTGNEIVIKAVGNITFDTTLPGSGWLATEVVPTPSGLYVDHNTAISIDTSLVTSKVILDYVGRSTIKAGGDLVIGGKATSSKGVQRFEIEVQDDSRLQTISSTNNTLREVDIKNGKTDRVVDAYTTREKDAGLLQVNGQMPGAGAIAAQLPGGSTSLYGFQDVREINGSAMTGKLEFSAELTKAAIDKYLKLEDGQPAPLFEDVKVEYTGGKNGDKMLVDIDSSMVASNSNINVGMADFTFNFSGNAGNDEINVAIDRHQVESTDAGAQHTNKDWLGFDTVIVNDAGILQGGQEVWYTNHRINDNVAINAGEGDDVIKTPGAGDFRIDANVGADTVYADNTGARLSMINGDMVRTKAAWVFNTANQRTPGDASQIVGDLKSASMPKVGSFGVKVQVNYRGILSEKIAIDDLDYQATQLDINQAIKKAINEDAALSKLLVAVDGPAGTLGVMSKVDGIHEEGALKVTFIAPVAADVTDHDVKKYSEVNNDPAITTAAQLIADVQSNVSDPLAVTSLSHKYYDTTRMALGDGKDLITGASSLTSSDNIIKPGVDFDTDVLVLGTTETKLLGATAAANASVAAINTAITALPVGATVVAHQDSVMDALVTGYTHAQRDMLLQQLDAALQAGQSYLESVTPFNATDFENGVKTAFGAGAGAIFNALDVLDTLAVTTSANLMLHLRTVVTLAKNVINASIGVDTLTTPAMVDAAADAAAGAHAAIYAEIKTQIDAAVADADLVSSNDTVVFEGLFGKDVIVNFDISGPGADKLDFTKVGGKSAGVQAYNAGAAAAMGPAVDGQIWRWALDKTDPDRNDSLKGVEALYKASDAAARVDDVKELYIVNNTDTGVADVYQIHDGKAAGDLKVVLLGHLDIAGDANGISQLDWTMAAPAFQAFIA